MQVDMPLAELERYKPELTRQPDYDAFWQQTLAESDDQPLNAKMEEYPYPVERVQVYHVTFDGFGGTARVNGWYMRPSDPWRVNAEGQIPTLIFYHGYTSSRNLPTCYLHWVLQGFALLTVDTRGQSGDTADHQLYGFGSPPGYLTRGLESPYSYYYRYSYMDCVRAVDFVRSLPETGPLFITGPSQGGGLTLAVAAIGRKHNFAAAMPDVPFLAHFRRGLEVSGGHPYAELANFWKFFPYRVENDFRTLSYFDGMNFAPQIECPVLLSVALLDDVCPPSTGFAVYNHLNCEKELKVYPYNAHEGGGNYQIEEQYRFVRKFLGKTK